MDDRHYRRVTRQLSLIVFGANVTGAILATVYFNLSTATLGDRSDTPTGLVVVGIGVIAALLVLGNWLTGRITAPRDDWYRRVGACAATGKEIEPPSPRVRQLALNLPIISAGMSAAMWLLAGLFFGATSAISSAGSGSGLSIEWRTFFEVFLGGGVLSGLVTTALIYFAAERVWRSEIPLFFQDASVFDTPAFRLTVRRRLLILLALSTIPLLLLAVVGYGHAQRIVAAPDPAALLRPLLNIQLYIVGIGVLMAVALALTLGASLADAIEALQRRMALVKNGALEGRLPVTSNDELGALAEGFNAMVDGLAREEVIRRLFGHYVTPQVAEHAIEHGADLQSGEYCQATVLFTDIREFTTLTERMGPGALLGLLNRYFQTISAVVVEHGGLVTRLGGDSLLAVFGTPLNPAPDHAQRAVQAAWGLLPALAAFNQRQVRDGEPTVRVGVGVATGPVLAGNVGSQDRLEYTVLGNAINLASRLEGMTKELAAKILIDEETAQAVRAWAPLREIGEIQVRGRAEPVRVYALEE
ncbi:MAG: adenylate/guanylate cyclase domain-containing protein [Anaerolineae bacterium]|nr:adenylate/guanylate cyclase domain-containing protein [Anaerolineae bacterium]